MILLEFHNRVIEDVLQTRLEQVPSGKVREVELTIADFDGVLFKIANPGPEDNKDATKIHVSINTTCFHELQQHGVQDMLKRVYGDMVAAQPDDGQHATIIVDMNTLAGPDAERTIRKVAMLKRHCFAAVFDKYFSLQQAGQTADEAVINYRPKESMFINAKKDRVTVVFSVLFQDDDDIVLGKVFMQEFKEGRRTNQSAPQVIFTHKEPPTELKDTAALTGDNVGYVTFVLFPRHTEPKNRESTIDLIQTFRDYLHYHIKCSKAYMHSRMRARTADLLKILNRARPDAEVTEKKTASGRTFSASVKR